MINNYLPFELATSGFASSEPSLIATAFLILFIAFPALAAFVRLGFDWLEETANYINE